jgi:ATP synthase protein I
MPSEMDGPDPARLKALEERLAAKEKARVVVKSASPMGKKFAKANLAWRMVIELVAGMFLGMAIGYGLDHLFGTLPLFLLVFSLLGFAAGVRVMMQTAKEINKTEG